MLKTRLLVAALLIPAFLAALFYLPPPAWKLLLALVGLLAAREWAGLSGCGRPGQALYVLSVAVIFWLLDHWANGTRWVASLSVIFWIAVVPLWLFRHIALRQLAPLLTAGIAVVVPTWLAFVSLRELSPALVLFLMGLVWVADTAAYAAGRAWGRHKLAPAISPGKTWEGVFGAFAAAAVYVSLWKALAAGDALGRVSQISFATSLVATLALVAISVLGDLFESHIKRTAGVKDSGTLIPGHGGVLDRIDSQTSVMPLALAAIHFFLA